MHRGVAWAVVIAVAVGTGAPANAATPAPFDVGRVMRQVHFAFHRKHGYFLGREATFSVAVRPSGQWSIAPRDGGAPLLDATGAALRLGAARLRVGGRPIVLGHAALDHVHQVVRRGSGVTERLERTARGVEQSWAFARRPGRGDLEVSISAGGLRFTARTTQGLHFRDPKTGLGVRYGDAVLIDAHGRRTKVPVRWRHGAIHLRIDANVLDHAAYPARLDPLVGPEIGLNGILYKPALDSQQNPAIAFDGTNYLVVWSDGRVGVNMGAAIYGARVTPSGTVLDPAGIGIATQVFVTRRFPAIAFDGTNYLVVWTASTNVQGARVTPAGVVLDPSAIGLGPGANPSVASDGTGFLVVASTASPTNGQDVTGLMVSDGGLVTGGVSVCTATGDQIGPHVTFDGTNYVVAWTDKRAVTRNDVYAARVTTAGVVLDPNGFLAAGAGASQTVGGVASDGTNTLVVWEAGFTGTSYDVYGTRISQAGAVLDPTGIPITTATTFDGYPSVAFNGTSYLVSWATQVSNTAYDILGARVDPAGTVLDTTPLSISTTPAYPPSTAVASDGVGYFVVWEEQEASGYDDVYGTPVDAAGTAGVPAGIPIATQAVTEQRPAASFDGSGWLVVWTDLGDESGTKIVGTRLDAAGTVLDPNGIAISSGYYTDDSPDVTFDGTSYVVAWSSGRFSNGFDIYAARVSTSGSVLDAGGIPIATTIGQELRPRIASNGSASLVTWIDYPSGGGFWVQAARIDATGTLLDTTPIGVTTTGTNVGDAAALASDGSGWLVAWSDKRNGTNDIYAARIDSTGTLVDPSGIAVSTATGSQVEPTVAYDGTGWLVAWADLRGGSSYDVYASRIDATGIVLDPAGFAVSAQATVEQAPALVFDGGSYIATWDDSRTGNSDVYASRIDTAGTVLDPGGFVVSADPSPEGPPRLATDGAGQTLVVYDHTNATSAATRAYARFVTSLPLGAACSSDTACGSGHCVDSVCCDTACGGGIANDCQACSVAAGAATDGTCGPTTGNTCNDHNGCTTVDTCNAGTCVGTGLVVCTASGPCQVAGACDPVTGQCSTSAMPDGTACNDGNLCTTGTTCFAGTCTAGSTVTCTALDACHVAGQCDPTTGQCSNPAAPDGTSCDDGNACTTVDTCSAGTCTGTSPVTCTAQDGCHVAGQCDPTTGQCSNPAAPDGTSCGAGGTCQAGACAVHDGGTTTDGGTTDAGTTADAGGTTDAGTTADAGTSTDGGATTDGGPRPDGGGAASDGGGTTSDGGGTTDGSASANDAGGGGGGKSAPGCGCDATSGGGLPMLAMLLVGLVALLPGRRRRAGR